MSRAIRSDTLTPPNNFIYELNNDVSQIILEFINKYTTVNQQSNSSYQELVPNTDVEMSVNDVFDLARTLQGQESGQNWMISNSLIDSMKELDMLSNELTIYNFIEPHSNPFFELNEYTKKLFENEPKMNRLDQKQQYNYDKQTYEDNATYQLGLEWQLHFHEVLEKLGFSKEVYERMTISTFWRIDSLLNATESMAVNKYSFIQYFKSTMPSNVSYNGRLTGMNFYPLFITDPLMALSQAIMCRNPTGDSYGQRASNIVGALRDVALANDFIALNPQVKTIGLTEISAYNHQNYYFKDEISSMTKQNTEFLDVALLPAFTTKQYSTLSIQFTNYAELFVENSSDKLEEQVIQAKSIQKQKITEGIDSMANHWFDMVKHLYKNKKIDDIGLLYSNLMFPNMNPQNNELYSNEFIDNLKPIQDQYSHRIDLGDGYSVSIHIYPQQINFQFVDSKYRNSILSIEGEYSELVKDKILEKGIPTYLRQPLSQILSKASENVNESSNFELRNVANRIYHIESQRKTKLGAINERVIKLAQMKFV
tara:strand:+ start:7982 stop:9598 length:1617 start_codon:yes stop_codon:yes gene_type:complete